VRTRVKICGITGVEQARAVAQSGADALGLVFYAGSPRAVDLRMASAICDAAAPLLTVVALFVDPTAEEVDTVLQHCAVDQLQFHGDESAAFCEQFHRPYIKALRMAPGLVVADALAAHPQARAWLFDSYRPGVPGGTGETFDWSRVPELSQAWLLAGGLNPLNVAEAISAARPPAVDVSGGVERAPGDKDPALIRQFMDAVHAADEQVHEDAA
jgi:phosphoribosylanthranilate isomerase